MQRLLFPEEPRGYFSIDLLILYAIFSLIYLGFSAVFGVASPDIITYPLRGIISSLGIFLQGTTVFVISYIYIIRYAGDDIGWWYPSRMQQHEAPQATLMNKLTWIVWGGLGTWVLSTAGVRAVLLSVEEYLEFNLWEVGLLGEVIQTARDTGATFPLILLILGSLVAAPLGEELLFRRTFYQIIIEGLGGKTLAVLGSGLMFAFTHGEPVPMFRAAVAGIIFAFAYHKTRAFLVPLLMHFVFNLMAVLTVLYELSPWLMP